MRSTAKRAILLKADYTHQPPEVKEFLGVLGSKQVPIPAVGRLPPDDPNNPIVFRDGDTPEMVLKRWKRPGRGEVELMAGAGSEPNACGHAEPDDCSPSFRLSPFRAFAILSPRSRRRDGHGRRTWVSFPGCQPGMLKGPRFVLRNDSRRSLETAKTPRFLREE